jgi:hypothetical protein
LSGALDAAPAAPAHPLPGMARSLAGLPLGPVLAPAGTEPDVLAAGGLRLGERGDPRRELVEQEPAGLVMVLSAHGGEGGAISSGPGDAALYTREAFAAAWSRVAPGGWLAWIAGDERVFLRGITAIREARRSEDATVAPLGQNAWAWRLRRDESPESPYRFLCLVPRNRVTASSAEQLLGVARALPLRELFGPGSDVKNRYEPLSDPGGPASADPALVQLFSSRADEHVLVSPATDDGPPVFEVRADRPVAEDATLAIASLALIGVLLFPLGARRHVNAPEAGRGVPLPVRIAEAPLGALLAGLGVALALRAVLFRGGSELALLVLPGSALVGLLLARFVSPRPLALIVPLAGAVLLVAAGLDLLAPTFRILAGSAISLGFGLGAGSQLRAVLREADPALARWILVAWGLAVAASPVLAARMVHDFGASASAATVAAGWLLALVARSFLPRWRR